MKFQSHRLGSVFILIVTILCAAYTAQSQRTSRPEVLQQRKPRPTQTPSATPHVTLTTVTTDGKEECDPDTVDGTCPGTFSFTYSTNFNSSPRSGGDSFTRAGFAFVTYFHKRIFVEVDSDQVVSLKPPVGDRVTGYGDTHLAAGADLLLGNKKNEPFLTVLYDLKIPTASESRGLGSGKVDHLVLAAIGKSFGKKRPTTLEFDIGNAFGGRSTGGFDNFPFAAASLRQTLDTKGRFILHVEGSGTFKTNDYIGDAYNLTYLQSNITDNIVLRTGGKFGITNNVTRAGFYFALKFTGNLKKLF